MTQIPITTSNLVGTMKRKALLTITGCTARTFETLSTRNLNPVSPADTRWSDYTIEDAFALQLMLDASKVTDQGSAHFLAARALEKLHPIDPFSVTGDEEMWVALVRYDWPDAPEGWDSREVVAGRWIDLRDQAKSIARNLDSKAKASVVMALSATDIAHRVFREARELGLPEGEKLHPVPEDLTGYPQWFQEAEQRRRDLARGWFSAEG